MESKYSKKSKTEFCQTNKCACAVFFVIILGIVVVGCVTFLSPAVRSEYVPEVGTELEEWWKKTIIYQIYPRSFQDSNNDGIGDLKGIISHLGYFNDIHVGALWLSPFFTSPMRDFGYDVSNYTEVDNIFGDMKDFKELVKQAHEKNLKIIIDFVPNHTSNESIWFEKSRHAKPGDPFYNFYVWSNGTRDNNGVIQPPNNWQSIFEGSTWEWEPIRQQYYYHAFLTSQPDLNYREPAVLEAMDEVLQFWLDLGVDGFRVDAIPHLFESNNLTLNMNSNQNNGFDPNAFKYTKNQPEVFSVVKRWRSVLDTYAANDGQARFLLAETVGIPQDDRQKYYEAGSVPFFFDMIPGKDNTYCGPTSRMTKCFRKIIEEGLNLTETQWPNFVISNHDNKRIADRIGYNYVDVMNLLVLTLPGTPTTYYGEELGMRGGDYRNQPPKDPYAITSNDISKSRDSERNPMQWTSGRNAGFTNSSNPWLPLTINTDVTNINVEKEMKSNTSSLAIYKRLALLREKPAFQNSQIGFLDATEDLLLYTREDNTVGGETYLVALNLGKKTTSLNFTSKIPFTGVLTMSTKPASNPEKMVINLSKIGLESGEGKVIQLIE